MQEKELDFAFILDGDADRIGMMGRGGRYIDAHHIILLVLHYLVTYQKKHGRVILSLSCATRVSEYARKKACPWKLPRRLQVHRRKDAGPSGYPLGCRGVWRCRHP